MIKSMTGYGCAEGTAGSLGITIELRSVNNRFLDLNIRMPRVYTAFEDALKAEVQKYISRGKIDMYVTLDTSNSDDTIITVNEPLLKAYVDAIKKIGELTGTSSEVNALSLARLQDVLTVEKKEENIDALKNGMVSILSEALEKFNFMRETEGEKMKEDILSRLNTIENLVSKIEERSPETVKEYRERLTSKMQDVLQSSNIDEARILTEAAIYADKVAVDEETVRLRSHISQFRSILELSEPVGRKLDFLVQEMNREANTTGSKCNDTFLARIVVDIKAEIEKIREQIQNIE